MKIHIFYRHFNISGNDFKGRPNWFDFEKCFTNLLSTIEGENVDLHLIMDGEIESNFVSKYKDKFTSHQIKAGADQSSFFQTWQIAKETEIGNNDLIYFLEKLKNYLQCIIYLIMFLYMTIKISIFKYMKI